MGVVEFVPEHFHGPPQSLRPAMHARKVGGKVSGDHELELGWRVRKREEPLGIASVEGSIIRRSSSTFSCDTVRPVSRAHGPSPRSDPQRSG